MKITRKYTLQELRTVLREKFAGMSVDESPVQHGVKFSLSDGAIIVWYNTGKVVLQGAATTEHWHALDKEEYERVNGKSEKHQWKADFDKPVSTLGGQEMLDELPWDDTPKSEMMPGVVSATPSKLLRTEEYAKEALTTWMKQSADTRSFYYSGSWARAFDVLAGGSNWTQWTRPTLIELADAIVPGWDAPPEKPLLVPTLAEREAMVEEIMGAAFALVYAGGQPLDDDESRKLRSEAEDKLRARVEKALGVTK